MRTINPIVLFLPIAFTLLLGLMPSANGHIETTPYLFQILPIISVFNPFLGYLSSLAFAVGDIIQKLIIDDVYYGGTGRTAADWIGARIGFLISYTSVILFGLLPGILGRQMKNYMIQRQMAGRATDGAVPTLILSLIPFVLGGPIGAAIFQRQMAGRATDGAVPTLISRLIPFVLGGAIGAAICGAAAIGLELPSFYLRANPDVSCATAMINTNIRYTIPMAAASGFIGGIVGPIANSVLPKIVPPTTVATSTEALGSVSEGIATGISQLRGLLDKYLPARPPSGPMQPAANTSGRIPATPGSYPPEGYIQIGDWYEPLSPAQWAPPTEVEPATETAPVEVEPATPIAQEPEPVSETPPGEDVPAERTSPVEEQERQGLLTRKEPDISDLAGNIADEILNTAIPPGEALNVFDDDKWKELTNKEREAIIKSIAKPIAEEMGIPQPKLTSLSSDALANKFGDDYKTVAAAYDHETDTVYFNLDASSWNSAIECADTTAHEFRHAYQYKIKNPKAPEGSFERDCHETFEHPIEYKTDPVNNMKQMTERDARNVGGRVNDRILQRLWEMKYPKAGK